MKTLTIMPRRTGKTSNLIKEFGKFRSMGGSGAVIVPTEHSKFYIAKDLELPERIFTMGEVVYGKLNGHKYDTLFIDEYFNFIGDINFYNNTRYFNIRAVGTSTMYYLHDIVDYVKTCKYKGIPYSKAVGKLYGAGFTEEVINNYWYNILTDYDIQVLSDRPEYHDVNFVSNAKESLPPNVFDREIIGNWRFDFE